MLESVLRSPMILSPSKAVPILAVASLSIGLFWLGIGTGTAWLTGQADGYLDLARVSLASLSGFALSGLALALLLELSGIDASQS
jgi:hypothetical protein